LVFRYTITGLDYFSVNSSAQDRRHVLAPPLGRSCIALSLAGARIRSSCSNAQSRFGMYDGDQMAVIAPTGGPNGRSATATPSERRKAPLAWLWLGAGCALLSHSLWVAPASAETPLRITGSLTLDASASLQQGSSELRARLLDDAGHPVSGAEVRITPLAPAAQNWTARECRTRAASLSANAEGAYVAHSDGSGGLCVHFDGISERAEFELSFSDPSGLYAPATRRVIADSATRSVEMAFAPAPSVLALESETQILSLVTRPIPPLGAGEVAPPLAISLSVKRDGGAPRKLAEASVEIGSSSEFRLPSRALGGPGPLEISAEFAGSGSTRAARATAHATCTALAELSLAEPLAASHPEAGVHLRVRVDSIAGAVPSGSVEARSGNVSLGSARVAAGIAELNFQLDESLAKARPVELRYVADSPWWLPAQALTVEIPILPPSPWRRIAWIAAVLALGGWLLANWQRPGRLERSSTNAARPAIRAPIDVIEVGDAASGWRGRVLDAHDGAPIIGAVVLVRLPAFDGQGVLSTAYCGEDGVFAIEGLAKAGPGAALEVRAPWHTPLAAPMPPPGQLVLSLVSRRRTLLGRFVAWSRGDTEWGQRHEPTPGEVARRAARPEVATWARAVDEAAFGPDPLSEVKEQAVVGREPSHGGKLS
jgi:hypothetical protein